MLLEIDVKMTLLRLKWKESEEEYSREIELGEGLDFGRSTGKNDEHRGKNITKEPILLKKT